MRLLNAKPAVKNGNHPTDMFSDEDLSLITKNRGQHREKVAQILHTCRMHGWYPNYIDHKGQLHWACMTLPTTNHLKGNYYLFQCDKCQILFRKYLLLNENPLDITTCDNCYKPLKTKEKTK